MKHHLRALKILSAKVYVFQTGVTYVFAPVLEIDLDLGLVLGLDLGLDLSFVLVVF
jgi:hypothetical protein